MNTEEQKKAVVAVTAADLALTGPLRTAGGLDEGALAHLIETLGECATMFDGESSIPKSLALVLSDLAWSIDNSAEFYPQPDLSRKIREAAVQVSELVEAILLP